MKTISPLSFFEYRGTQFSCQPDGTCNVYLALAALDEKPEIAMYEMLSKHLDRLRDLPEPIQQEIAAVVERLKGEHLRGEENHSHVLWALLVFQDWRRRWCPSSCWRCCSLCP